MILIVWMSSNDLMIWTRAFHASAMERRNPYEHMTPERSAKIAKVRKLIANENIWYVFYQDFDGASSKSR